MVSNAARLILAEAEAKGSNLHDLADYAAVQINDTHPSMVIPELIRLLQEKGILMDEAIEIVSKVCAYTCLLYTSPSPRDLSTSRMPSSA